MVRVVTRDDGGIACDIIAKKSAHEKSFFYLFPILSL
jgi:hypothetical protein